MRRDGFVRTCLRLPVEEERLVKIHPLIGVSPFAFESLKVCKDRQSVKNVAVSRVTALVVALSD